MFEAAVQKAEQFFELQGLPPHMGYLSHRMEWGELLLWWKLSASAAMGKTDITLDEINSVTSKEAQSAVTDTWLYIQDALGGVLQALVDLNMSKALLSIPRVTLRKALIALYVYTTSGALLHWEGAFERAIDAGRLTERDAREHLDRCIKLFEVIAKLGGCSNTGAPEYKSVCDPAQTAIQFVNKKSVSGVGFTGVEIGLLVVAGIAAITITLGVVYLLTASLKQMRAQERAMDQCAKLLEQGQYEAHEKCATAVLNASNAATADAFHAMDKGLTYVAVGLGIYVAMVFLPSLIRSTREAREAASSA
jgi:type II secretory pathway pseudopilin PulG